MSAECHLTADRRSRPAALSNSPFLPRRITRTGLASALLRHMIRIGRAKGLDQFEAGPVLAIPVAPELAVEIDAAPVDNLIFLASSLACGSDNLAGCAAPVVVAVDAAQSARADRLHINYEPDRNCGARRRGGAAGCRGCLDGSQ